MKTLRGSISALAILGLLACAPTADAARVTLTGGDVLEGQILERSDSRITIKTMSGVLTLPMSRVTAVDEGGPGASQMYQAAESLRRGDLEQARSLCEEALQQGANADAVNPLLKEINQRRSQVELSRYRSLLSEARDALNRGEENPEALVKLKALLNELGADSPAREEIVSIICDFHLQNAARLRDRVQNVRAEEQLRQVIALDPSRALAYLELADLYKGSSGTWQAAIDNYGQALERGGDQLEPREKARIEWETGEIYRQRGDWEMAAKHYRNTIMLDAEYDPRLVDRYQNCILKHVKSIEYTQPDLALSFIEEGIKPRRQTELLLNKALILQRLDRTKESTETFEELIEVEPRRRDLHYHLAQNYFRQGEILEGRELLNKEIEIDSRHYDALVQLGEYALQRDDYDEAQNFFRQARAVDADLPRAALGLGRALLLQEKLPEAREAVQAVLARLPEDREANLEMGRIFLAENELDKAKEFFTEVLKLIDKAPVQEKEELKQLRADALIARGEISLLTAGPGTANYDFQEALKVLPDYGQAYYHIGRAYRNKFTSSKNEKDLKEAETNLLKARELQPENPQFALELGILYADELAQVDPEREKQYVKKGVENWQAYIDLGGANAELVRSWIAQKGV